VSTSSGPLSLDELYAAATKVEDMDKKKFLVLMVAAVLTAFVLVWLQRGPHENPTTATPPKAEPVPQQTIPEPSSPEFVKAGTCQPTVCRFAAVISPAFETSANGKVYVGVCNLAVSSQSVFVLKNVSPDPVTVSAVTLYTCLNELVVDAKSIPVECQFIKIAQTDFKGGTLEIKPGESMSTTLAADAHGQIAKLQYDTTRGPIITQVTVQ
jgi:hypothetical protein